MIYSDGTNADTLIQEKFDTLIHFTPWVGEVVRTTCVVGLKNNGDAERVVVEEIRIGAQPVTLEHEPYATRAYIFEGTLDPDPTKRKSEHLYLNCMDITYIKNCWIHPDPYSMMRIGHWQSGRNTLDLSAPRKELMDQMTGTGLSVTQTGGLVLPNGEKIPMTLDNSGRVYRLPEAQIGIIREHLKNSESGTFFKLFVPIISADGTEKYVSSQASPEAIMFALKLANTVSKPLAERADSFEIMP